MYLIKAIFLLLLSLNLLANQQLKSNYFIQNNYVLLSDIVNNPRVDLKLYDIDKTRHSKRIKSKLLIKRLQTLGYKNFNTKHNYTQFTQKSPINMDKIKLTILNRYNKEYQNIKIKNVQVNPRSYLTQLPSHYKVNIGKNSHLNRKGILYLKTLDNKKIFFNYIVEAKIKVIKSKNEIKRGDELSNLNTKKKSIILNKFRAMPLQELKKSSFQAKTKIKADSVLTTRDFIGLNLIRRGSNVHVSIINLNMAVSFMAKAHQNGRYGETIVVINKSGKKIKVLVTGRNIAEIR
jgi:flagella basal body P-ring formation protein FlgA